MNIIYIELRKTYYYKAFFNVRMVYQHLFGDNGEVINIQIGLDRVTLLGRISRELTVNRNGTPRIYVENQYKEIYLQWVQANYTLGDQMKAEIVSPKFIILYAKGE